MTLSLGNTMGTLTAIAYDAGGRETGRSELSSAYGPFGVAMRPEKDTVKPGEIVTTTVKVTGEKTLGRADFKDI